MADFLFPQFSAQLIKIGTDIVTTTGYNEIGKGGASYIADGLANAAFHAAHPRFVGKSSNSRYFRALPLNGALTVEVGGAVGDDIANDQPAIQAAVAYAEAIGCRSIVFTRPAYRLFCPIRTSDPEGTVGQHAYDGRPLVIASAMTLSSSSVGGTILNFRNSTGNPRETGWQVVYSPSAGQDQVWRGGGLFLRCPASLPVAPAERPAISLVDITLNGGIPMGSYYGFPARLSDGDGWDVTDKGIEVEPDRFSGDIRLIRSAVKGFRGELIFQAGENNGELFMRSAVLADTNGDVFQSCGTNVDIDGLFATRAYATFEGWSGRRGRIVNAVFEDCISTGGMQGGRLNTVSANRNAPRRFSDGLVPWLNLDAEFRNCGNIMFGSWTRGRLRLTDSPMLIDANGLYSEGLHDIDLDVLSQVDQLSDIMAVALTGGAMAGSKTLTDVRLRLTCSRSEEARRYGRMHTQPVAYSGSIGPNVVIERSSGETKRYSSPTGPVTDFHPCFRRNSWTRIVNDWSGAYQDIAAAPLLSIAGDTMAIFANGTGNFAFSLPSTGINDGHQLTLVNGSSSAFCTLAASGAGAKLPARRVIAPGSMMRLRFASLDLAWREEIAPPALVASAALPAQPTLAVGAVSAEISVPLNGAVEGMAATATPQNDLGSDVEVCQLRSRNGTVTWRLRNLGVGSVTPPAAAWTVSAYHLS